MSEFLKPEDMGWDSSYVGIEPQASNPAEAGDNLITPSQTGQEAVSVETGRPIKTPEELGYYPEELEAAKEYALRQRGDTRTWGQYASDIGSNIAKAANAITPTALGGKGTFGPFSTLYETVPDVVQAPRRLLSGEIPMYDVMGQPREQAIAEIAKVTGFVPLGRTGTLSPLSEVAAKNRISSAIQQDIRANQARGVSARTGDVLPGATASELSGLAAEGVPVSAYDLSGGPAVKKLVQKSYENAPDGEAIPDLLAEMGKRKAKTGDYIASTIDKIAGKPVETGVEFEAAVKLIKDTNDPAYTRVMSMPEHQNVFSPELQNLVESRDAIAKAVKARSAGAANRGAASPPIYNADGSFNLQPYNSPSLEFWNDVYRKVRDDASSAYRSGDTTDGKDLYNAANALREALDRVAVKDAEGNSTYKMIRDDASEVIGAKNALEAGYKFLGTNDPSKLTKVLAEYGKLSPYQQSQFKTGVLSNVKDAVTGGKTGKIVSWFDGSNPRMYSKIEGVLGPDDAMRLSNQVRLQNIVEQNAIPSIPGGNVPHGGGFSPAFQYGAASLAGAGSTALLNAERIIANLPAAASLASHPLTAAGIGAVAGPVIYGVGKKLINSAKNAYEARVSQHVLDAIATRDPAKFAALEKYPPSVVKAIVDRASNMLPRTAIMEAGQAGEEPATDFKLQPRVARKSGGRIKSNPISAEVRRVRALLSEKTANMLSLPDDAIATALHIAKRT